MMKERFFYSKVSIKESLEIFQFLIFQLRLLFQKEKKTQSITQTHIHLLSHMQLKKNGA